METGRRRERAGGKRGGKLRGVKRGRYERRTWREGGESKRNADGDRGKIILLEALKRCVKKGGEKREGRRAHRRKKDV